MDEIEKPEVKAVKPFEVKEVLAFVPNVGDGCDVTVVELPEEGSTKYKVKFPDGSVTPVNACYLKRKE